MSDEIETTTMVLIIPDIQSAFKVSGTGMVRMQFDSYNLAEVQQLMRWGNHKIAATFAPIIEDDGQHTAISRRAAKQRIK